MKNPLASYLQDQLNQFGKENQAKSSDIYVKALEIDNEEMAVMPSNPMAAPAQSAKEQEDDRLAEIAEEAKEEAKKTSKQHEANQQSFR